MKAYITVPGDRSADVPDEGIVLDIDDTGWKLLMQCCDVVATPEYGEGPDPVDLLRGEFQKCFAGIIGEGIRVGFDCDPPEDEAGR